MCGAPGARAQAEATRQTLCCTDVPFLIACGLGPSLLVPLLTEPSRASMWQGLTPTIPGHVLCVFEEPHWTCSLHRPLFLGAPHLTAVGIHAACQVSGGPSDTHSVPGQVRVTHSA